MMFRTMRSAVFLVKAPILLVFLFIINLMTSPGHWWVQWAALGLGIAWVFALIRVVSTLVMAGGVAAVAYWLMNRGKVPPVAAQPGAPAQPGARVYPDIPTRPLSKQ